MWKTNRLDLTTVHIWNMEEIGKSVQPSMWGPGYRSERKYNKSIMGTLGRPTQVILHLKISLLILTNEFRCHNCNMKGHFKKNWRKPKNTNRHKICQTCNCFGHKRKFKSRMANLVFNLSNDNDRNKSDIKVNEW